MQYSKKPMQNTKINAKVMLTKKHFFKSEQLKQCSL